MPLSWTYLSPGYPKIFINCVTLFAVLFVNKDIEIDRFKIDFFEGQC